MPRLGFKLGDKVRVERDENLYPPKGTWPRYRGREGTVVNVNARDGEVGVWLGDWLDGNKRVSWFLPRELRAR